MSFRRSFHCRALLRAAAFLVPLDVRADWLAEWRAELWHAFEASAGVEQPGFQPTAFCLGAFPDALALRAAHPAIRPVGLPRSGSPTQCLLPLLLAAAAAVALCLALPPVRAAVWPASQAGTGSLVLISREGSFSAYAPTIQLADYRLWKAAGSSFSKALVFYRPIKRKARIGGGADAQLRIGYVGGPMLRLLRPSLSWVASKTAAEHRPAIILSEEMWQKAFGASPPQAGHAIEIDGKPIPVVGVAAQHSWPIPGRMDALLLSAEASLPMLSPNSAGFILAPRFEPVLQSADGHRVFLLARTHSGFIARFECLSLSQTRYSPLSIFLFTLLMAALALPATTALPLGDYPAGSSGLELRPRIRRWFFLLAKVALILPLVGATSLVIAYQAFSPHALSSLYGQLVVSFSGLLFGLRWALGDQRRRCPICLHALSHPALVGHPSCSFLAWSGTELACCGGHGLLYIPALPTSWCGTQRWHSLDPSWSSFFLKTA